MGSQPYDRCIDPDGRMRKASLAKVVKQGSDGSCRAIKTENEPLAACKSIRSAYEVSTLGLKKKSKTKNKVLPTIFEYTYTYYSLGVSLL